MACTMTNTPPTAVPRPPGGFTITRGVVVASTANVNLATASAGTVIDGVTLVNGTTVLLTGQTSPTQNSCYVLEPDYGGDEQGTGSIFTGGVINLTGLDVGRWYWFTKGNASSAVGLETLTDSGLLRPTAGGLMTINGPAGAAYTGVIVELLLRRTGDMNQSGEFTNGMMVQVSSGTANKGVWQYTGVTAPSIGTSPLPWTKVSSIGSSAITIPGTGFSNTAPAPLAVCAQLGP